MKYLFECEIPTSSDNFIAWTKIFLTKRHIYYNEHGTPFFWILDSKLDVIKNNGQIIYAMHANKCCFRAESMGDPIILQTIPVLFLSVIDISKNCILLSVFQPSDYSPETEIFLVDELKNEVMFTWPQIARSLVNTRYNKLLNTTLFEFRIAVDPYSFLHWCSEELSSTRKESYQQETDLGVKSNSVYTQILPSDKIKPVWECVILAWESFKPYGEEKKPSSGGVHDAGIIASIEMIDIASGDHQATCRYNSGYEHLRDWLYDLGIKISSVYGISPSKFAGKITERKAGRPHFPEDKWAWQQVNLEGRSKLEVYKEWKELPEVKQRDLADEKRHFNHITHYEWMSKRNK